MSRLLSAVVVALAIAAGITATQAPGHAATTRHVRICWGSNRGTWDAFHRAIPASRCVRVYYDKPNVFPRHWPDRAGPDVWTLLSIRPTPWMLLHHRFDRTLRELVATAPAHSLLTIWHENAVGNNPLGYSGSVRNPAIYRRMQTYMERLVHGTKVRFGTIGCGPVNQAEKWYAPHLDWYGVDLYLNDRYLAGGQLRNSPSPFTSRGGVLSKAKVWARMDGNLAALRKVSGERYPLIRIGESNASPDSYRKMWFTDVASWFASHDGNRPAWIDTFWKDGETARQGGLSGPWPPGAGVVRRLNWLTHVYSWHG